MAQAPRPTQQIFQPSFSSGELSPSLHARIDLDAYHSGLSLCRNFFVDYRGGARNRAGTRWVGRAKGQNQNVRIVKFAFNVDQTYILEFGDQYMRVAKNAGYVLEPSINITAVSVANPGVVTANAHGYANGDEVYIPVLAGMPSIGGKYYRVANVTANTFTLRSVFSNVDISTVGLGPYTGGGTTSRIFTLVTPYVSDDIFSLRFTQSADVITITHNNYQPRNLTRTNHWVWNLAVISFATTMASPTGLAITTSAPANSAASHKPNTQLRYGVTAVSAANGDESIETQIVITVGQLFEEGTMAVVLTWDSMPGASYYNIYRAPYGKGELLVPNTSILGLIGSTKGTRFPDKGFTADFSITPPNAKNPLSGQNPLTSTYFQERKVYAGSYGFPETIWTSQTGSFNNMNVSLPALDDDAITMTLASLQVNAIKHLIPMPGGLIAFTTGSVWQVSGGGINNPITPASLVATPQGYTGAGEVPPIPTNFNILYPQKGTGNIRDLSYNFFVNIYQSTDISVMSSHLFLGHAVVDWTFAEDPWKVFWIVRDDGKMLSLTYSQENEVKGWAWHDTLGLFRSACAIHEGGEDFVYVIVERPTANGWVRYLERMESRLNISATINNYALDDCWFLDSALDYPLVNPASVLTPASAAVAENVNFVTSPGTWAVGDVGNYIRFNGGLAVIRSFTSATTVVAEILYAFPSLDDGTPIYAPSGTWSSTKPIQVLTKLDHLEGKSVMVLADGGVIGPKTVTNGSVDIGVQASRIICGLPYKSQLGTLYMDTGNVDDQGRRKSVPAVTVRVELTRGIKAGAELSDMTELKPEFNPNWALPAPLITDDVRIVTGSYFNTKGQTYIEQSYPLPAAILGIIPTVWIGDR